MSAWQNLSVVENNDVLFTLDLTDNGVPFDITAYTVSIVLKSAEAAADNTGTTFTTSNGLTVVSAKLGQVTWALPHTSTTTPGTQWWRCDVVDVSSNRTTVMMGNLVVQAA